MSNINNFSPRTGRMLREDGSTVNIADLFTGMSGAVKPANYLYVGKNGDDITADGSANLPFKTISAAMTTATSGTTILAWPGTYTENITFKAGVYLTSPAKYSVYATGNHVANFTGTVVNENIVFGSATGNTISFAGTGIQNLQFANCSINSGTGDGINWTNTNVASKIAFDDGSSTVATSGASARCFYSASTAKGTMLANRASYILNNPDNIALAIGGAVSFIHTSDQVIGQVVVSNTATYLCTLMALTTGTVPVMVTNSSGVSVLSSVLATTTASPAFTGAGGFAFVAIEYGSSGVGGVATLNGGIGAQPLTMAPIRIRASTLLPNAAVAAGMLGGTIENDGTDAYITLGTTRYKFNLTAV